MSRAVALLESNAGPDERLLHMSQTADQPLLNMHGVIGLTQS